MAKKDETNQRADTHNWTNSLLKPTQKPVDPFHISGIAGFLSALIFIAAIAVAVYLDGKISDGWIALIVILASLIGTLVLFGLKVARQWEKAVVLRLGRFRGLRGPGMFWILPIVDTTPVWIDHRVMVTPFNAEKTLTKDTVPVDVDAVLFWVVWDAQKAALEVEDYRAAIAWASQTALREIIGQMYLADILVGRAKMDEVLQKIEESLKEKGSKGPGATDAAASEDDGDELLPAAVEVILETGQASVSMLQRRLKLGYSRAARLVDQMEERGIVGPFEGSKPRQLLITRERWQELQMAGSLDAGAPCSASGESGEDGL